MEEKTLATELLHELKASSKRWFIAFCIMTVLEIATIAGFLWYISLPVEEYEEITQEMEDTEHSTMIGVGDYNGKTDGKAAP